MFEIKNARLLEYNEGEFEGNKFANIIARHDGKLLKFKLDRKQVSDVSDMIDTDVNLSFDVVKGQNSAASIKVVGIVSA